MNKSVSSTTPNGLNGLAADLSNLFSSFQLLANEPGQSAVAAQGVVRSAQEVAAQFNRASTSPGRGEKRFRIRPFNRTRIRANQILKDIAGVNQQIMEVQSSGRNDRAID